MKRLPKPFVVIRGGRSAPTEPRTTTLSPRHLAVLKGRYLSLVDLVRSCVQDGRFAEAGI